MFCFVDIGGIVDHHCINILCFVDIGGIVNHQCLNFLLLCLYWRNCWPSLFKFSLFCWYWWNCRPSLFKLSFVLLILVELSTITVSTFFCFLDIGGIVDHHCLNFLLLCWYWRKCWPSLSRFLYLFLLVELLTITV